MRRDIWDTRWLALALLLVLPGVAQAQIEFKPASSGLYTNVADSTTATATSGTAEEVLYTLTIPAGTFSREGSEVSLAFSYATAANGNAKTARIRMTSIGGTGISAVTSSTSAIGHFHWLRCVRVSSSAMGCWVDANGGTPSWTMVTGLTFTNAIVMVACGTTATAAGDITIVRAVADYRQ